MAASSPVAIPAPSHRTRGPGTPRRQFSPQTGRPGRPLDDIPHGYPLSPSITESCYVEFESPGTASLLSPGSDLAEGHDCQPFSPPSPCLRRSSSANSSLSSSSTSRWTRGFSPPREPATGNDPLCIIEDREESDDDSKLETESATWHDGDGPHISARRQHPPRRQRQFKSNLTASLQALRDKLPSSIPSPVLYSPTLPRPGERSYSPPLPQALPTPLCSSLPIFDSLPHEAPVSSAIHLQTYSVSLGPPRKPREVRINSDFFRLLALEMEMRRSGKFVPPSPEIDSTVQGILVSGKVRMTLPRRSDKERDDINMSTFNKSRLKW